MKDVGLLSDVMEQDGSKNKTVCDAKTPQKLNSVTAYKEVYLWLKPSFSAELA